MSIDRTPLGFLVVSIVGSVVATLVVIAGLLYVGIHNHPALMARALHVTAPASISVPAVSPIDSTVPDVVEKTVPAVVSVVIKADVPIMQQYNSNYDPFGGMFPGFNMMIPQQRQVGTEKKQIGGGSGFFVSPDGYIVTNRHVVDTAGADYSIVTNDGTTYPVKVVAKDPTLDVAILKVESTSTAKTFPYLTFASSSPRLGESVLAIGNALAEFPNSVSLGVVSGLSRTITAGDQYGGTSESLDGLIQTDAAINHGNSGGPLLNLNGQVVGVNTAVANGSQNIGFALPAKAVASVYQSVAKTGKIVRPFLGVRFLQINGTIAKQNDLSVDYGVLVVRGNTAGELAVMPGSPADKAGIQENDIILEVNGVKLDGTQSLPSILRQYTPGTTVHLKIQHKGKTENVDVTLSQAPDSTQ